MFTYNINPVLVHMGPLEIRYYAIVYVFGFLLVYYIFHKKRESLSLSKEKVESLVLYIMLGTIIGARLGHVFLWEPAGYFQSPLKIFAIWQGGMSFHGGLIGVLLAAWFFCRKNKVSLAKIADASVIQVAFVLALGRVANFINGELYGTMTNVSWCVNFPAADGCRHPYQIYAAISWLMCAFVLVEIKKLKSMSDSKDGFLFWCFILLFGISRFVVDFFREDPQLFGLSMGQYLSTVMVLIGSYVLWRYYKNTHIVVNYHRH